MLTPELKNKTFIRSVCWKDAVGEKYNYICYYTRQKQEDGFFYAYIVRKNRRTGQKERFKVRKFKVRWKAKDFAYKMYCKYAKKTFISYHRQRKSHNCIRAQKGHNPFEKTYICVSNVGIEEDFDVDVEYLGIPAKKEEYNDYLMVENKFGVRVKVSKERFKEANG